MKHPTYDIVLKLINTAKKNNKINILDYGCGSGTFLEFLPIKRINQYEGYDPNEKSLKQAKEQWTNNKIKFHQVIKGKAINIKKTHFFDFIIVIGVLQYLTNEETSLLLKEFKRIINKDGYLIISCLTDHSFYKLFDFNRFFSHYHYLNRQRLKNILKENGFLIDYEREKGIFVSYLFSQISIFFDFFDKILFRTNGYLGLVGNFFRLLTYPLSKLEYLLPVDFGYTLFFKAKPYE